MERTEQLRARSPAPSGGNAEKEDVRRGGSENGEMRGACRRVMKGEKRERGTEIGGSQLRDSWGLGSPFTHCHGLRPLSSESWLLGERVRERSTECDRVT